MAEKPLEERDYLKLLNAVRRVYAQPDPAALTATMLDAVLSVIPAEHASYDEVDLIDKTTAGISSDPAVDAQWPALQDAAAAHFHQHPVLHYFHQHPRAGARRLSDFIRPGRFKQTGLYRECYRHIGVDHQMVARLPGPANVEIGLALSRTGHDFTARDLKCLNLLRPHLQQAWHRRTALDQLHQQADRTAEALDALPQGMIVLDSQQRVLLCTDRARAQLRQALGDDAMPPNPHALPRALNRWLEQLDRPAPTRRAAQPPDNPWTIPGPSTTVAITAMPPDAAGRRVLRLDTRSAPATVEQLQRLGLTQRQAQTLYWVAHGKTNIQIGRILHISPRTVQKHLEHIFQTLGVQTRTEATVKALQAAGE